MNTMVMIEINNGTFDEWKKGFDDLADKRAQFSRDAKVGKVDDHTAIVVVGVHAFIVSLGFSLAK